MVDHSITLIVFSIHDTSIELTVHQASYLAESSEDLFIEPLLNPNFFLDHNAALIPRAHSSWLSSFSWTCVMNFPGLLLVKRYYCDAVIFLRPTPTPFPSFSFPAKSSWYHEKRIIGIIFIMLCWPNHWHVLLYPYKQGTNQRLNMENQIKISQFST